MAVYYSQEVRQYGLVTLLGALSTLFFVRALQGEKRALWGYVIFTTLALYTMYYAVFLVICQLSAFSFQLSAVGGQRSAVRNLLLKAFPAMALLYLPWVIYAGDKLLHYVQNKTDVEGYISLGPLKFMGSYLLAFSVGHPSERLQGYALAGGAFFALIALFGAWYLWRQETRRQGNKGTRRQGDREIKGQEKTHPHTRTPAHPHTGSPAHPLTRSPAHPPTRPPAHPLTRSPAHPPTRPPAHPLLITLYLFIPLTLGWLVNLKTPFTPPYFQRTLLIAAPAWWLLVGAGLAGLWQKKRALALGGGGALLAISLIFLADFYTFPRYQDVDYRPLLREVTARATPDDALLASYQWQLGYYHAYLPAPHPQFYPVPAWGKTWGKDSTAMTRDLQDLLATRKVWFPAHQASGHIWEDNAERLMAQLGFPALLKWYNAATKLSLVAPNAPLESGPTVNFEGVLQAQVRLPAVKNFESGRGVIPLEIIWTALQDLPEDYLITLKLVDNQGEIWAKRDTRPRAGQFHFNEMRAGETLSDRHGLLIDAGTPPGEYSLRLTLSSPTSARPLNTLNAAGQAQGAEAALTTVTVTPPALPVGVDALARQVATNVPFGEYLNLVGYSIGTNTIKTGEILPVNLFWQGLEDNLPELIMFVQLQDAQGNALALTERPPIYPTANWQSETLLRDLHRLKIPAALPGGTYKLAAGVLRADKTRLQTSTSDQVVLGKITVQERPHTYEPPQPMYPADADFGGAALIGYDVTPQTLEAGEALTLTLYWRGQAGFDESWTVFAHLIDQNKHILAQQDQLPGKGKFPTGSWTPGEYIRDTRQILIPADAPSGNYRLKVGLYNPVTFRRVPLAGGGDSATLETGVAVE